MEDAKYKREIRSLRQTMYTLSTQGGSQRILLVGSTQKLNDVYKPVRSNMATKILLRSGDEEIETLSRSHHFNTAQKRQLKNFRVGQGMILRPDDQHWPIEFCGARCGLGDGDRHWRDRYAIAAGARVRESPDERWPGSETDLDWWLEVKTGRIHRDTDPSLGTWYLIPEDLSDIDAVDETIGRETIREACRRRREHDVPSDILLVPTGQAGKHRSVTFRDAEDAEDERLADRMDEHAVPHPIRNWADVTEAKRNKFLAILDAISSSDCSSQSDIQAETGIGRSSIGTYLTREDELKLCADKDAEADVYRLSRIGERALEVDWPAVLDEES